MNVVINRSDLAWLGDLARRLADHDGDDLVQESWLHGAPTRTDKGWLAGVLRNRWRMNARATARRRARERAAIAPAPAQDPETALARAQVIDTLLEALSDLDPADRQLVVLRHCEGLTSAEIGERLELPAATVRTRLRRTLARLRTDLTKRWGDDRPAWQLAVAPLAVTKGTAAMTLKALLAATVVAAVGTAVWVAWPGPSPSPSPNAAALEAHAAVAPAEPSKRDRWTQTRDRVRKAHADRDAPRFSALSRRPFDIDEARQLVGTYFGEDAERLKQTFFQVQEQLTTFFSECLGEDPTGTGRIRVRATLIGEPDVGVVVETVDVQEDTVGDPELTECIQQSVYSFDLDDPPAPVLGTVYDFSLDMDKRTIDAGIPIDRLFDIYKAHPELIPELGPRLEDNPGLAAYIRDELERSGEDLPALAALLEDN